MDSTSDSFSIFFLSLETALRILIPNYVNKRVKCFDCQRLEHIDHYTYIMRIAAMLGCMSACSLYNKLSSHSVLTEQCGLLIFDIPVLRSHVENTLEDYYHELDMQYRVSITIFFWS